LTEINATPPLLFHTGGMTKTGTSPHEWLPISIAPEDCDLQLGAIGRDGISPWAFPCRKHRALWFNVWTGEPVLIHPTHWRIWRM
jgi:hypothetical protein